MGQTGGSMDHVNSVDIISQENLAEDIRDHRPVHPALSRLHDRMIGAEREPLTSYSRMHHRHNRS